ncbi:MAG: IS110 family transposase [Acidobacteria bacterium]|nr:IS110 family transposase [Acidobacteriota bacterium]
MNNHRAIDRNRATYVGIDVHPGTHTAFAMNRFEDEKGSLQFENSQPGIQQFLVWLRTIEPVKERSILGVEGRGGNGHALIGQLIRNYPHVYEVNTLFTKKRRTFGPNREKTDERDAKLIAEVLTRKLSELPMITQQEYRPQQVLLKKIVEFYGEATNQGTRLRNQLHRLTLELSLAADAQQKRILAFTLKEKQAELQRMNKRRKTFVKQLAELLEGNGKNLTSFPGIDTVAAARITAETNGVERFHSLDGFISYAGIGPVEKSSGKNRRFKQNHGGNRQLNSAFFMIAICNLRCDPKGKAYYQKKLSEGKSKKHAIRCLMQRIASVIYGMLKNGDAYRAAPGYQIS